PPSHVVFILATTDPNKVPPTIHSRVQRFDFRRISTEILVGNIREYTIKEGINITDEALTYIAKLGDGSARDTLSILDKAASVNKELDIKALQEILGNIDSSIVHALAQSILEKDASEIISIIEHINSLGKDYMGLVQELISHFRDLLVKEISKNSEIVAILIYCLEELITLSQTIKNEKYPRLFVEIYCIKMALHENTFNPETIQTSELVQRTTKQEAACEKSQITDWRTALNKEEKYKKEETKKEVQIGLTEEQIHELTNKINTQIEWR
ncbi:MAG: hypothetical protein FWE02_06015, partial [Defluviitaleaceae bacterium]|nr:hypothetical protein [Defluviitaleaceae bacterium]